MPVSHKLRLRAMEWELKMFWALSREANAVKRVDPDGQRLAEICDEAEVMALNTDWPALQRIIRRRLDDHSAERQQIAC